MDYSEDFNPFSIREKKSRLVDAVRRNNVNLLKDLLDSPKWYNTTDNDGCNLLQIAIRYKKKEVFDYLLSLEDYPSEFENIFRETALGLSLSPNLMIKDEYFACELIKRGACIDKMSSSGDTFLHLACKRGFLKASMLLIEKGIDVNASGYKNLTPLQSICKFRYSYCNSAKHLEIIFMLLEFGADPSIRDYDGYTPFEGSVNIYLSNKVQEALFYYTFDEFSLLEIHLDILLKLAARNSPLFHEIITQKFIIIVKTNESTVNSFFDDLKYIDLTNLKTIITKYETSFKNFFTQFIGNTFEVKIGWLSIEKLNILIESGLKDEIVNVLLPYIFSFLPIKIDYSQDESELTEYICFLLSYGMKIEEECLYLIYKKFGYCESFKILLHMDFTKKSFFYFFSILPNLLINATENLEDVLKNRNFIQSNALQELMSYFAHPKLLCYYREQNPEKNINIPEVPSLVELSRNIFRRYFIKKFKINSSSQFYTLLNCLEIGSVYKKIISYETKLYSP